MKNIELQVAIWGYRINVVTPQHTTLYEIKLISCNGSVNIIKANEIDHICEETAFFDSNVTKLFILWNK